MVRETSSRDRYRKLKRDITAKLTYERCTSLTAAAAASSGGGTYRTALTKSALLPLTAIALPTIRESTDVAKRTLSDPQKSVLGASVSSGVCCRSGRSVRPMLRPCLAALPMRSWNSYEFNSVVADGVSCKGSVATAKRAKLCRNARVDDTTAPDTAAVHANIPIIISSPDDCGAIDNSPPSELVSAGYQRRSSCPSPAYDDDDDNEALTTSLKRRRNSTQRRPSAHSVKTQSESAGEEQKHEARRTSATTAEAVLGHANSQCNSSSLDVYWPPTRRLSLPPHAPTSLTH